MNDKNCGEDRGKNFTEVGTANVCNLCGGKVADDEVVYSKGLVFHRGCFLTLKTPVDRERRDILRAMALMGILSLGTFVGIEGSAFGLPSRKKYPPPFVLPQVSFNPFFPTTRPNVVQDRFGCRSLLRRHKQSGRIPSRGGSLIKKHFN